MKISSIFIVCFALLSFCVHASVIDTTQLIIIGTRHDGNAFIKPDSFLQIFRSFNPAIILYEGDSSSTEDCKLVEGQGVEIAIKYKIYQRSIEKQALLAYQKESPAVCVKDYDIFIANRFQYIKDLEKLRVDFSKLLDSLYDSEFIKKKDKKIIEKYWKTNRGTIDIVMEKGLFFFNQTEINAAFRTEQAMKRNELLSFFKKYSLLQKIEERYRVDIEFWEERNTIMVKNILEILRKNFAKKIILICGARHKYFLLDKLLPLQGKNQFIIKEFWQ